MIFLVLIVVWQYAFQTILHDTSPRLSLYRAEFRQNVELPITDVTIYTCERFSATNAYAENIFAGYFCLKRDQRGRVSFPNFSIFYCKWFVWVPCRQPNFALCGNIDGNVVFIHNHISKHGIAIKPITKPVTSLNKSGRALAGILNFNLEKWDSPVQFNPRFRYAQIAAYLGLSDTLSFFHRQFCGVSTSFGFTRCMAGVERRSDSGNHGYEPERKTQGPNNCLLVSEDRRCFGGVRRTSLLYKIISLQAVFFFGFFTAYSAFRAFPPWKRVNSFWLAVVPASAIIGCLSLVASVTGKIWLFGI